MLGYHHNLIQHTQLHFTQAKVTNVSSLHLSATLSIYQYILVCTCDVQVHTYTLHMHTSFQSGTIAFATLTSLLPTLVRCFAGSNLPLCSLLDSQAAQARLATSKLPQPRVNLVDVAAAPAILRSSVCTTRRETRTLVLYRLVCPQYIQQTEYILVCPQYKLSTFLYVLSTYVHHRVQDKFKQVLYQVHPGTYYAMV